MKWRQWEYLLCCKEIILWQKTTVPGPSKQESHWAFNITLSFIYKQFNGFGSLIQSISLWILYLFSLSVTDMQLSLFTVRGRLVPLYCRSISHLHQFFPRQTKLSWIQNIRITFVSIADEGQHILICHLWHIYPPDCRLLPYWDC